MRVYLAIFGREVLDLHIGTSDWEAGEPDARGDCVSMPIGFAPNPIPPFEADCPDRDF